MASARRPRYGKRAGALQRAGLDDAEIRERYDRDADRLDDDELQRLYGTGPMRFLGGVTDTTRDEERYSVVPAYNQRSRAQFRDEKGREYVVADHENEARTAYVYLPVSETRRRNADPHSEPQRFPDDGEYVTLHAVDDAKRTSFPMRVRQCEVTPTRRASALVEFVECLPTREQYESEAARRRRERVREEDA